MLKTRKEASKLLGIHYNTLYRMSKDGEIETTKIGKHKMYNIDKYLKDKNINNIANVRRKICYCRVSSQKQKEDLKRQIDFMQAKYPNYEVISDVGSSLNMQRNGLKKIIDYAVKGEIEILIVAYKDRLMRIGYELIEGLVKDYSKGDIVILNKKEEATVAEEISQDIMAIMNVYVAKINGLRKYKKMIKNELEPKE